MNINKATITFKPKYKHLRSFMNQIYYKRLYATEIPTENSDFKECNYPTEIYETWISYKQTNSTMIKQYLINSNIINQDKWNSTQLTFINLN